jgi:hypothetical protein
MIPRIKNNFITHSGSGPTWAMNVAPLPKTFDNYFVESCKAAEEIYSLKEGPLHLMYSGGIDSEHALSVFLHMGMNITPVIVRLLPNYNDHDISYALKFCESKNIKPIIIDIYFDNFVKSGKLEETNKIIKTSVLGRATTCYAMGLVDGSIICGEGDPHIVKDEDTGIWYFNEVEHSYTLENYMEYKGIDGTIFFNGYTPEMFSSFLTDPRMRDLADNKIPGKLGSYSSKHIMYNRHSNFNLEERPKYNGYEKIINSEIAKHPTIEKCLLEEIDLNGYFRINYHDLIKDIIK